MKIALVDDVHNEFQIWNPVNPDNADVLVMAGDVIVGRDLISKGRKAPELHQFFQKACELYNHIIYVVGNHEMFHGDFIDTLPGIRKELAYLKNLHILEKQSVKIEDTVFLGCTMWTDCNREDPISIMTLKSLMNDYRVITNGTDEFHSPYSNSNKKLFQPEDSVKDHKECLAYFRKELGKHKDEKCVVVSHHAPTFRAVPEEYRRDYHMNSGYYSNLDQFILNRPQIKYWLYGHVHFPKKFKIGETTLINNARGYVGIERNSDEAEPYLPITFEV